jgi:hypothetical protein
VQANGPCDGTFHHLIALFSTVAGKAHSTKVRAGIFCNQINDLAAVANAERTQKNVLKQALRLKSESGFSAAIQLVKSAFSLTL